MNNIKKRFIRGLRSKNNELKADNEKLMSAFKHTQENFSKEMSNMKSYERQMREQQDVLTRMQVSFCFVFRFFFFVLSF